MKTLEQIRETLDEERKTHLRYAGVTPEDLLLHIAVDLKRLADAAEALAYPDRKIVSVKK